ncbi:hypothetical protein PanWU01x14_340430 [Parasponia andersonii]|uniref:Uncharacterized protein n=1 Tax=Parasponia andersonii TaxID=3476 RepID=A0A2P5AED6_PARAD|nr:hypothetical protein PanWU01x14_340430 [Parasponia andersonii]
MDIKDIINVIVKPPSNLNDGSDISWPFSIWGAIIRNTVWRARNEVVHKNLQPDPSTALQSYYKRVEELQLLALWQGITKGKSLLFRYSEVLIVILLKWRDGITWDACVYIDAAKMLLP